MALVRNRGLKRPSQSVAPVASASPVGGALNRGGFQGYVPEATNLYSQGMLNPQSQYTTNAAQRFAEAANMNNPLLNTAMGTAQGIMSGSNTNDPNLQAGIDAQMRNLAQSINRDTSTEAAMAGQVGSPAARGLVAERMGAAAAPVITNALSGDFARRQQLAANMALNAPTLGGAYTDQAAKQGGLLQQAGGVQEQQALGPYQALTRFGGMLNLPGMLQPGQTQTQVTPGASRLGGIVGGALAGFGSGNPWMAIPGAIAGGVG